MDINYQITEALISEAYLRCHLTKPEEIYRTELPGERASMSEVFLREMGWRYMLPAKSILIHDLLDDDCYPIGLFRSTGWIVTTWKENILAGGYCLQIMISPEAKYMLEYIYGRVADAAAQSKKSRPRHEKPEPRNKQSKVEESQG